MVRSGSALLALLFAAGVGRAELEIKDVEASYGRLGPVRKTLEVYPHDEIFFRFLVTGVATDDEGRAGITLGIKVATADGETVLDRQITAEKGVLALGGGTVPGFVNVELPQRIPPGEYTLTVRAQDRLASAEASFERKLTVKPVAFLLVAPQFFYDAERQVPAPAGGLVGQQLHFRLAAIGLDRGRGRIDAEMTIQLLDAEGKEPLSGTIRAPVRVEDPDVVKKVTKLNLTGFVSLNRPGRFTLRVSLTDRLAKKTAKFETPLRVFTPSELQEKGDGPAKAPRP